MEAEGDHDIDLDAEELARVGVGQVSEAGFVNQSG